jgi:hypothetical protein
MTMTNPAEVAGPNRDGSHSLAKESKVGVLTTFLLGTALLGIQGWIDGNVDVATLPGWLQGAASYAVAGVTGLIAAYLKKNR